MLAVAKSARLGMSQFVFFNSWLPRSIRVSRARLTSSAERAVTDEFCKLSLEAIFDVLGIGRHQGPLGTKHAMGPHDGFLGRPEVLQFGDKAVAQGAGSVRVEHGGRRGGPGVCLAPTGDAI